MFWLKVKLIFSAIGTWVFPLLRSLSTNMGQAVLKQAIVVVKDIAISMAAADNETKRKAAFNAIVASLKKQGLQDLESSVINAAIETAVQFMKSKEVI